MSLTLDLPQELESALSAEVAQFSLSVSEYALRILSTRRVVEDTPKTGAELVAYWQNAGLIGTRSDIPDSQKHARKIRNKAEKRIRAS